MRRLALLITLAALAWVQEGIAAQWDNVNQPGVAMDNVLSPTNRVYDGWGSWYDDGTGLMFHGTNVLAGNNHPGNPAGHGFIAEGESIHYTFTQSFFANSPAGAQGLVEDAFGLWEQDVNQALGLVHNPDAMLGFDWSRAEDVDPVQIEINWLAQGGTAAAWVDGYPNLASFAIPKLQLTFVSEYWSGSAWVATNFDLDMSGIPANPGPAGAWTHPYDLFTTALHELGHLAGLDDLYNLDGNYGGYQPLAFPGSTMGTPCAFGQNAAHNCIADPSGTLNAYLPYHRYVDLGSLQGVVDLYTIPEPRGTGIAALGLALVVLLLARATQFQRIVSAAD